MKAFLRTISRIIPAITFIFSGLIKAIDPVGGAIKFEDYFTAFQLDWLSPLALPLAIALAVVEFLLGFYLLLGFYVKKLATVTLGLMAAFTLLTLYIAIFNPVSDCGCFGDALKLTNWQTFGKNVIVIGFTIVLFLNRKKYSSQIGKISMSATAIALAVYIIGLALWNYNNLPVIDFRPFKIGNHIASQMEIPEGAEQPEIETKFILEKDGQRKTFTMDDYPYDDSTWVFIDSETKTIREGFEPPLHDFHVTDPDLGDATNQITNQEGPLFLLVTPSIENLTVKVIAPIAELAELAQQKGIPFYCLTASGSAATMQFDQTHKTMFRFFNSDETTLKTMIRSNPGLILVYDGTIAGKWHYGNIPEKTIIQNPLAYALSEINSRKVNLIIWANILALILIPTLIINRKTIIKKK